jgi:5-methylcytosine-specific restriction endonuclease McrA
MLRQFPLCADPYQTHAERGEIMAATQLDHIQPIKDRPDLVYNPANLAPLCGRCHARKNAAERRGGPTRGRASS